LKSNTYVFCFLSGFSIDILIAVINTADPTIYIISGLLPAEAEVHKRAIIWFGCICRSGKTSTEWKIAERQLSIKNSKSKSWFIDIRRLFIKYGMAYWNSDNISHVSTDRRC
jgi:hypothetical protein